jgi:hypothetical protein
MTLVWNEIQETDMNLASGIYIIIVVIDGKKRTCTLCNNEDKHQMRIQKKRCASKSCKNIVPIDQCSVQYKVLVCVNGAKKFYQTNEHRYAEERTPPKVIFI